MDVKLDAYPSQTFKGVISEINQTTQTYLSGSSSFSTSGTYTKVTQLIPAKVLIGNKENLSLIFGMNATVKIHLNDNAVTDLAVIGTAQKTTNITGSFVYNSSIKAADQVTVSPDVSGRVTQINVEVIVGQVKGEKLYRSNFLMLQAGPLDIAYLEKPEGEIIMECMSYINTIEFMATVLGEQPNIV